ncbi:MAG: hypothetical protein D3924_20145, partial [Candidatus Electrothrix sp. AR4]|nr:hypothetical protein [Candidatus Electrothrix sp. AR4]
MLLPNRYIDMYFQHRTHMTTATLGELAALVDGTVSGDKEVIVTALNSLELAQAGEMSFFNSKKLADQLDATGAT